MKKLHPFRSTPKKEKQDIRPCLKCTIPKEEKAYRNGCRTCRTCEAEKNRAKRAERWSYLGLDMSSKF